MRRKPNKELYDYLKANALSKTIDELLPTVNDMIDKPYTRLQLQKYLVRNNIPYKYSNPKMVRTMSKLPIGTEHVTREGRTKVKVSKNKWVYKTRYFYEQYHHVTLTDRDYILQIDRDLNNFNINNLVRITRYESFHLKNYVFIPDQVTYNKAILDLIRLRIKIKDK